MNNVLTFAAQSKKPMKKQPILKAAGLLSSVVLLFSCSKSKDNTDQLSTLGKALVSGKVHARTVDTSGAALTQNAPAGTVVTGWIDSRDLVTGNTSGLYYARRYFTGKVDENGYYNLGIDVSKYKSATVYIDSATFEHDVLMKDSKGIIYVRKIFKTNGGTITVNNGENEILDIQYF